MDDLCLIKFISIIIKHWVWKIIDMNQIKTLTIFILLLLTRAFIPDDIKSVITGPTFALNPAIYFPFDYFSVYRNFVNSFNYELSDSLLNPLGIKSDSTVYNCSSLVWFAIIWALFHLPIFLIFRCWSRLLSHENATKWTKVVKYLVTKIYRILTFAFYIRTCLEINQFMLISSISEIHQFKVNGGLRIVSLVVAFLILALCLSLIVTSFYLTCSSYKTLEDQHNKLGEFFAELKSNKKHRLFSPVMLLRRALFVSVLLVFDSTFPEWLLIVLFIFQLVYTGHLIILRPFEEVKANMIEVLNEIYLLIFYATLIFVKSKDDWTSAKILAFILVISSNGMIILLVVICKCKSKPVVFTINTSVNQWKRR